MSKKGASLMAVYIILFIVYNVLFFIIPFPKGAASWVAYGFSILSFIISGGISFHAFKEATTLKSKVYGFPIFMVGNIYLACQIAFCIIIYILAASLPMPCWISVIVSVILLGMALIGVIATDSVRNTIESIEKKEEIQTRTMAYFRIDMESIADSCRDPELSHKLHDLSEEFKYSDPVSSEDLAEAETHISFEVSLLSGLVSSGNNAAAAEKVALLHNLLSDRNRRCRALKK
ncbi:hypothetical protein [Clostridium sp. AM58-1XD]|uniref:hypothetical protein n=1 Tax=Clostridium sp. AM58-1XD TaxID=2292307 RepID=UPI000E4CF873|nr:hypothetical protein [Clostridium sp. AM58-1XD]RGY96666.1 hypothetical protein DXA13_16700 [Clostridium sp. AM58-1XD]